jgi:hypothetical protein
MRRDCRRVQVPRGGPPYAWEPARLIVIVQAPRFAAGIKYQSWLLMRAFIDRLSFCTRVVLMICIVLTTYVIVIFQFPS